MVHDVDPRPRIPTVPTRHDKAAQTALTPVQHRPTILLAALLATLLSACTAPPARTEPLKVEFLTRDGCGGSAEMRANLDAAIARSGLSVTLEVIDVATLAADDPRTGYGTPTILKDGKELFGMPRPAPAAPT